jgi:hypothetical protein
MISGGRYLSGGQEMRVFAASVSNAMRVDVRWRNGQRTTITAVSANHVYEIDQGKAAAAVAPLARRETNTLFTDVSASLNHKHTEDSFDDWTRQPLLPHRLSRFGPARAGSTLMVMAGKTWPLARPAAESSLSFEMKKENGSPRKKRPKKLSRTRARSPRCAIPKACGSSQ